MELEILERSDELTRLGLTGRLDTAGADKVGPRLNAALARGGHALVDLSGVTFLSSLGIRLLLTAAKMVDRRGSKLVLVAPAELVAGALRHSSIDDIIPVVPDIDGALALLRA